MRVKQRELNFSDSTWKDSSMERSLGRSFEAAGRMQDFSQQRISAVGRSKAGVVCLECSHRFYTSSMIPECPGCGGSDVELA